ncbi:uncharacterized protein LOC108704755 isoform X2 [Xenopus laevis]|uniref:Uncharacterized protein LOC108704755 isoform X1 n=1 Tax=Xenopus laevis TaxID=8355 RepID=A0A8J1LRD8_XENLA|nr:uncharacterized protein LOC108704755 isoform X1 [Xenopus laevis]XP_041431840.1 uncharacterized protein LOC108704755 isoform X2 [Xenopus laevis]
MACWKFLLILVLPTAAGFVLDITASSPQHALLGNEVHLRCTFSVAKPPINPLFLAVFWYFQDTEILRYDNKGLSISPRVTFSKEAANNGDVSLSLANVTISDGGLYKCLVIYSPEKMEREVLLEIFVSPVIQIPNKVIQKNKENTLTCMANCFYPVDINIIWYKDNEPLTNSELGKPERNPDGTYRVMGTVTLPPMDGKMDHNFSCKVQHASLQQPLQEDFQLEYEDESNSSIIVACGIAVGMLLVGLVMGTIIWNQRRKASLQGYTVSEIKGPEKLLDGEETTLYCTVSNCPQEDPQVTWIEERSGDQWEIPQCRDPGEAEQLLGDSYLITCRKEGLQSYCSSLRFVPRVGKHRDVTLICRFVCAEKTKEKRFHCTNIYAKPAQVSVVPFLCESGEILYSLTLRGFYPRHISITWTCGAGHSQGRILSKEQIEVKPDLTFSVCSEARISGDLYKDPAFRVGVTWEHGSLDAPGYREFSILGPEFPWDPIVELKQETKFLHNIPTTLQCNISEYFPDALTVTWLRKGAESEELTEVPNTHPYIRSNKQTDNTYSCTPCLIIYPSVRDQGAEYICRVTHPSLVRPIDTSTGTINVMAKPMFLDPVQMDLLTNGRIQFSITLRNFYPRDIHINWSQGEKEAKFNQAHTDTVTQQQDLTYNITSVCSLPGHLFSNPEYKVHVTWNHVTMEAPESRELWVTDLPWRPQVGEILVPTLGKKKVTLSCKISGYFPDALTVSWFRKGKSDQSEDPLSKVGTFLSNLFRKEKGDQLKPDLTAQCDGSVITDICTKEKEEQSELTMSHYSDWSQMTEVYKEEEKEDQSETSLSTRHYKVSEAKSQKQEDQTFTCETQLTFSPDQKTDQGAEFICRVRHPSLGQLIERRTGPLVIPQ